MKFFRFSIPTIVIVCALLLSGASGPAKTPIAAAEQNAKRDGLAQTSNTQTEKSHSAVADPAATKTAESYAYRIENYYYNADIEWSWPKIFAASSALGLLIFAALLMFFVRRSAKATEMAATAVAENAIAIRELANLERPWIIISEKTLIGFPVEESPNLFPIRIEVSWKLSNVGRSPAIITGICKAVVCAPVINFPEPIYAEDPLPAGELLIPPAGDYTNTSHKNMSEGEYDNFMARNLCIMFYGRVQYYDSSRRDLHVARFCYRWYRENDQLTLDSVTPRNYIEFT